MKTVRIHHGRQHYRTYVVPETYSEAYDMLVDALAPGVANTAQTSVAMRVAYGMWGDLSCAPNPTTALIYVLQEIVKRHGAGLDRMWEER